MDIAKTLRVEPGHYIVAVSGGVDSMALLDMLHSKLKDPSSKLSLTVAHFDHGIRVESKQDRLLVGRTAKKYGLPFVYAEGALGPETSEDTARKARYEFLRRVQEQANAQGIITAHHLDDVMETATHNLLRGTGRKGMSSLKSTDGIVRPLLHIPKNHLLSYARANNLMWLEDKTNQNLAYRRNYIRHQLLPLLRERSPEKYDQFMMLIRRQAGLNQAIDTNLHTILHVQPSRTVLRRHDVITLPHQVGRELVGEWLRLNGKREFNRRQLEKLTMSIKTGQPNTTIIIDKNYSVQLDKLYASLISV